MNASVQHPTLGKITWDGDHVTVENDPGGLDEMIERWLEVGSDHYSTGPLSDLVAALKRMHLDEGLTDQKEDGTEWPKLAEGEVY
jgi:hypothetical protein